MIRMHIIIDGYNVLKQALGIKQVSESQRRAFINMLGRYAARKNHSVSVVFDGGPNMGPSQTKDHGIVVIYSGFKQSADDVIKRELLKKQHILLVTSDKELKSAAQTQTTIMDSLDFYQLIKQERASKPKQSTDILVKTSNEENSLIDALMRADTQKIYKDEDEKTLERGRRSNGQTLSKQERAYLQKLKKL